MLEFDFSVFPVLRTERLLLRSIADDDVPALFVLRSDPRVMQHIKRPLAKTLDDARSVLAVQRAAYEKRTAITWAITRHGEPELVGSIGLWNIAAEHHRGELGYLLRPDLWGQGITREAARAVLDHGFGTLHLHRIEAQCDPANVASIALLDSLGFAREGHLVQNVFLEGAFLDTVVYGMLNPG